MTKLRVLVLCFHYFTYNSNSWAKKLGVRESLFLHKPVPEFNNTRTPNWHSPYSFLWTWGRILSFWPSGIFHILRGSFFGSTLKWRGYNEKIA
jgi:hypothetical protein